MIKRIWKDYQRGKRKRVYAKNYAKMYKEKGSYKDQKLETLKAEERSIIPGANSDYLMWIGIAILVVVLFAFIIKYAWIFGIIYLAYLFSQKKK